MADRPRLPFDPRDRNEPESDRPAKPRTAFVTRDEMNAALAEVVRELQGPIRRIESMAIESRNELREAKKERELRAQWDRELREREQIEAMREKTKSESDLIKALHTPAVAFPAIPLPASKSDPQLRQRYNRAHVIAAVIAAISTVAVAAIGAWASQHGGHVEASPIDQHP